jgi:sugar lactone lactonase YvrE
MMKIASIVFILTAVASVTHARPKTYDAAISILGQPSMDGLVEYDPKSALSMDSPDGLAIDPTTGKLFVSDTNNHRILRFSSVAAYRTNAAAEAVFGQANFSSDGVNRGNGAGNPSNDSLNEPANICVDSTGRLWVADKGNARVLKFNNASEKESGTATADAVIGQPNFTSNTPAVNLVSDSGFVAPTGVAVDSEGRLWVSDSLIPRVLRFDGAAALSFDAAASGHLGDVEADAFVAGVGQGRFATDLWGLSVDQNDNLWVADAGNHRVLFFGDPAAKPNEGLADKVLGQPDFDNSAVAAVSAVSMNLPYYVTAAPDGTLWVSDYENHRVLGFLNSAGKASGDPADLVLGQMDLRSDVLYPYSSRATRYPSQIAIGREGSLFIGEYINIGHVKRWSDPVSISVPQSVTTKKTSVRIAGTATGASSVIYKIAGQKGVKPANGTAASWNLVAKKLSRKKTNVTVTATAFDGRSATTSVKVKKKTKKR